MKAVAFIIGGGVALLAIAVAASKAKASMAPAAPSGTQPPAPTAKPPATKPPGGTVASPLPISIVGQGGAGTAPAYLSSIPYVIAMRVLEMSDQSQQQAQGVWLADNGYPQTGEAVQAFSRGELTEAELRATAQAEFKAHPVLPMAITKPQGTTVTDVYGSWLLENGSADELYSYAMTSTSMPLVESVANRLAAAGDSRAAMVTQHLAELKG